MIAYFAQRQLRGQIRSCAGDQALLSQARLTLNTGQAKIHHFDLALRGNHHIFGFEVTVNHLVLVRIFEGGQDAVDDRQRLVEWH
jgi:hypothetical protein